MVTPTKRDFPSPTPLYIWEKRGMCGKKRVPTLFFPFTMTFIFLRRWIKKFLPCKKRRRWQNNFPARSQTHTYTHIIFLSDLHTFYTYLHNLHHTIISPYLMKNTCSSWYEFVLHHLSCVGDHSISGEASLSKNRIMNSSLKEDHFKIKECF